MAVLKCLAKKASAARTDTWAVPPPVTAWWATFKPIVAVSVVTKRRTYVPLRRWLRSREERPPAAAAEPRPPRLPLALPTEAEDIDREGGSPAAAAARFCSISLFRRSASSSLCRWAEAPLPLLVPLPAGPIAAAALPNDGIEQNDTRCVLRGILASDLHHDDGDLLSG